MAGESSLARVPLVGRIGVGAFLVLLTGLAYYVVFYSDVSSRIAAARAKEATLRTELQTAKANERAYQEDLDELGRRRERQRELNKILPSTTEYPAFLSSIQSVANSSGVNLSAWGPQPEQKEQFYAKVPMKVELSGRFHQIAKFFYGIGQSDRIMNIENVELTSPKEIAGEEGPLLRASGLATAFRALETSSQPDSEDRRGRRRAK